MNWLLIAVIIPVGYFLLRVLESIILNVVGNILTDPIKNWLASRSLTSKRKRIDQLKKEFDAVTKLHQDKTKLFLEFTQKGLSLFGSGIFCIILMLILAIETIKKPPITKFVLDFNFSEFYSNFDNGRRKYFCLFDNTYRTNQ